VDADGIFNDINEEYKQKIQEISDKTEIKRLMKIRKKKIIIQISNQIYSYYS
jgi:hypothetical protein